MRIPQKRTIRSVRATQPSTPPSNVRTTGPQGTPGGRVNRKPGAAPRKKGGSVKIGREVYLWVLVAIELGILCGLRKIFRRYHGG